MPTWRVRSLASHIADHDKGKTVGILYNASEPTRLIASGLEKSHPQQTPAYTDRMTDDPPEYRMYGEFAHLWQQISSPDDYAEEAAELREVMFDLLRGRLEGSAEPYRPKVLEMGVGGGNILSHMTGYLDAVATDSSPEMLDVSRVVNPSVEHIVGDMRTLRLDRIFDAVMILDAISYMLTLDDLRKTFETARAHLEPGGVFIAGPDWIDGITAIPNLSCKLGKSNELSYAEYVHDPDPNDTEVELIFNFYIPQPDGSVKVEEDRHRHGLFPLQAWLLTMREARFEPGTRRYPADTTGGSGYYITGIAI